MPRYAVKISLSDLVEKAALVLKKMDEDDYEDCVDPDNKWCETRLLETVLQYIHRTGKFGDDIKKIEFDFENVGVEQYITTPGYDFCLLYAGGDWEVPVLFALYYDGKNIRGYVPSEGNVYNRSNKKAFGNDEANDIVAANKQYGVKYEQGDYNLLLSFQDKQAAIKDIIGRLEAK